MAYEQERIKPYNQQEKKESQVEAMFNHIAPAYDFFNNLSSFGFDRRWRRKGIDALKTYAPQVMLDVATGTGDLAILAAKRLKPSQVIGVDISDGMMEVGRQKVMRADLQQVISFQHEDCTHLSFENEQFDAVMASFGIRNFQQLDTALAEMLRVLRPGGHLMVLELSQPQHPPMKQLFWLYSHLAMPLMGAVISGDRKAYSYLTASIEAFPQGEVMEQTLKRIGFSEVKWERLTFGVCTLYIATK